MPSILGRAAPVVLVQAEDALLSVQLHAEDVLQVVSTTSIMLLATYALPEGTETMEIISSPAQIAPTANFLPPVERANCAVQACTSPHQGHQAARIVPPHSTPPLLAQVPARTVQQVELHVVLRVVGDHPQLRALQHSVRTHAAHVFLVPSCLQQEQRLAQDAQQDNFKQHQDRRHVATVLVVSSQHLLVPPLAGPAAQDFQQVVPRAHRARHAGQVNSQLQQVPSARLALTQILTSSLLAQQAV